MTQYYYHQDHLGNICAEWDATHDSVVQQTLYYASVDNNHRLFVVHSLLAQFLVNWAFFMFVGS